MRKEAYEQMKLYLTALVEFGMHGKLHRHQRMCIFWEIKWIGDWIRRYEMEPIEYSNYHGERSTNRVLQSKMNHSCGAYIPVGTKNLNN